MPSVKESFNYITYSDATKFETVESGRIQLKGYPSELMLYSSFDVNEDADYAISDATATTGDTVAITLTGVFSKYAHVINSGYIQYNSSNFTTLTTEGSIKFRLMSGFNNNPGQHDFTATTNPTIASGDSYEFRLYVEETLVSGDDIVVALDAGDTMSEIADKIDTALTAYNASALVTGSNTIRIYADNNGDSIVVTAPNNGNSMVTLLTGLGTPTIPNAPDTNTNIVQLIGTGDSNKIFLTHDTSSNLIIQMFDNSGDTALYANMGVWSNRYDTWYAFEFDWNESIMQLFIDGELFSVQLTGFVRGNGTNLKLASTTGNAYRFDELIVYNEYQNTKDYTVETTALGQYDTGNPYIDVYFKSGFVENEITDLNVLCASGCHFAVKMANTWYYYLSGAWRTSNGTYSQSTTPDIMETKFHELYFIEESDLTIRIFFHSDGTELVWLDEIEIIKEIGAAEAATITGSIDLSSGVDLSSVYNVIITTGSGSQEVNVSTGAAISSAVTLDEIKDAIDAAAVPGLADASDDGEGHLVLISSATGDDASVAITNGSTNDALAVVWGYEATDAGAAATETVSDYTELYRWVRSQLGDPIVPVELTDQMLEDALAEVFQEYNRWRNFEDNLLYATLSGNSRDGYTIPTVVGGKENIYEITMHPRYPFSYYAGRTDLVTNLYVQYIFQRYKSGYSNLLTDYFITISTEQDISIILGTQVHWEIINNKIFIWPQVVDTLDVGIRYRGSLTTAEVNTNIWVKRLLLARAKIILGTIRATFGGTIPGGTENITLRGEALIQEGKEEWAAMITEMKSSSEPLEFIIG